MHRQILTSPGQILDITSGYWNACTLHAAVELGVFTALGSRTRTGAELAEELACQADACISLLNALTALGLLVKEGDRYANTEAASLYLTRESPSYLGDIVMHHHHLVDRWQRLAQAVREGGPMPTRDLDEEHERRAFLLGMENLARLNGPRLIKHVNLKGRRSLLDLGGGPGTYSRLFCETYRDLHATLFDRPTTLPYARHNLEAETVGGRIMFVGGDFLTDALPGRYDVVWASHILHSFAETECDIILAKAAAALEPGGILLIHEFILNDTKAGPLFPALFSLNMLLNNGRGRSYAAGELTAMMERAGLGNIRRLPYQGPNDGYVLRGEKP